MDLNNKTAVITGVSTGIGKELVLKLLKKGVNVAGWGLHRPDFEDDHFKFYEVDIRNNTLVEDAIRKTTTDFGEEIHILINNAGLGYFGPMEKTSIEQWSEMFETNVNGIFYTSKVVIPIMKKMGKGHILNISSVAGLIGMPYSAGYCGTKFAVRGISHAMFKELRNDNIKVTCIYPGTTKTSFFRAVKDHNESQDMMEAQDVAQSIINVIETADSLLTVDLELRPMKNQAG